MNLSFFLIATSFTFFVSSVFVPTDLKTKMMEAGGLTLTTGILLIRAESGLDEEGDPPIPGLDISHEKDKKDEIDK